MKKIINQSELTSPEDRFNPTQLLEPFLRFQNLIIAVFPFYDGP